MSRTIRILYVNTTPTPHHHYQHVHTAQFNPIQRLHAKKTPNSDKIFALLRHFIVRPLYPKNRYEFAANFYKKEARLYYRMYLPGFSLHFCFIAVVNLLHSVFALFRTHKNNQHVKQLSNAHHDDQKSTHFLVFRRLYGSVDHYLFTDLSGPGGRSSIPRIRLYRRRYCRSLPSKCSGRSERP